MELRRPDGTKPEVALRRRYFEVGAIGRVGLPGRLGLFGLSLTGDDEVPGTRLGGRRLGDDHRPRSVAATVRAPPLRRA